jgi:predicted class III extradiol MEMO1 family dioxygenase
MQRAAAIQHPRQHAIPDPGPYPYETRSATHAGSWYDSSKSKLNVNLETYLSRVPETLVGLGETPGREVERPVMGARAVIAP